MTKEINYSNYGDYEIKGTVTDYGMVEIAAYLNGDKILEALSYDALIKKIDARETRLEKKDRKKFERFKVVELTGNYFDKIIEVTSITEDEGAWIADARKDRRKLSSSWETGKYSLYNESTLPAINEVINLIKKVIAIESEIEIKKKLIPNLKQFIEKYNK